MAYGSPTLHNHVLPWPILPHQGANQEAPSSNSGPNIAVGTGLGASVVIGHVQQGVTGFAADFSWVQQTASGVEWRLYNFVIPNVVHKQSIDIVFVSNLLL